MKQHSCKLRHLLPAQIKSSFNPLLTNSNKLSPLPSFFHTKHTQKCTIQFQHNHTHNILLKHYQIRPFSTAPRLNTQTTTPQNFETIDQNANENESIPIIEDFEEQYEHPHHHQTQHNTNTHTAQQIDEIKRCSGCGTVLQTTDKKSLGYIPPEKLAPKKEEATHIEDITNPVYGPKPLFELIPGKNGKKEYYIDESLLEYEYIEEKPKRFLSKSARRAKLKTPRKPTGLVCERCHFLLYQNTILPIQIPVETWRRLLEHVRNLHVVVLKMVDIFDFNGTFVEDFRSIIGSNPVILVGNKVDLLPKDIHENRVKDWLRHEAKNRGLHVNSVFLISSKKGFGIKELVRHVESLQRGRDVYVMGSANVGKSTFINKLITEYRHQRHLSPDYVTTSSFPGTTLNMIDIPFWPDHSIVDTPGIFNPNQIASVLTRNELKLVVPSDRVKPVNYPMIGGQTMFIGGLARFDLIEGPSVSWALYLNPEIKVHITKTENADSIYGRHAGDMLSPPIGKERAEELKIPQEGKIIRIKGGTTWSNACADLVMCGVGWASLSCKDADLVIKVYHSKGIEVLTRHPLVVYTAKKLRYRKGRVTG
eukprot:TRINITY_DN6131_c0_g1_i1.p1 TRINITY_DN6131_c0_g1~~TRINITY_DN6131_c0_g1_i1.p1  ORF type:complete len:592 (-),score=117.58 TRINITY_DN6131_c0_g1_i1:46-1821(-)